MLRGGLFLALTSHLPSAIASGASSLKLVSHTRSHPAPPTMTSPNPSSTPSPTPSPTPRRRRKPSPHSIVARMTHLARVRDLPALDAFVAASAARGFVLNAVNYTLLANARLSAGDAPGARRVVDDMRAASVPPTNGTMRTSLRCADDVVGVADWFRDEGGEDGEAKILEDYDRARRL